MHYLRDSAALTKSRGQLHFLSRPRPLWPAGGGRATRPPGVIKPGSLRTLAGHVTLICQGIRGHKPIYLSPIYAGSIYSCWRREGREGGVWWGGSLAHSLFMNMNFLIPRRGGLKVSLCSRRETKLHAARPGASGRGRTLEK